MDLLVILPAFGWGLFLAYAADLVSKKPDREWERRARYLPVRWFVSPDGWPVVWFVGAFLLLCAVVGAWQNKAAALCGIVAYAVTVGRSRWPGRTPPPVDPLAFSAFTLGLRVAADTFETLERSPADRAKAANVTGLRLQSGILTVYVREADPSLESFIKSYVRSWRPDLPVYVVADPPHAPDPNVM